LIFQFNPPLRSAGVSKWTLLEWEEEGESFRLCTRLLHLKQNNLLRQDDLESRLRRNVQTNQPLSGSMQLV
jgi:hypothetical protein